MRCLKLKKYSVISWIRTYLNRRLPHLIFKIRLCLIWKSGHFLEVTLICHKQFLEAMALGSNPGLFHQAPVDVSGFTLGPGFLQDREGRRQLGSHPVNSPPLGDPGESPAWRLSSLFSQGWDKIEGWEPGCCRPCPLPSPLFHPNKILEPRDELKDAHFARADKACGAAVWCFCCWDEAGLTYCPQT